MQKLAVFCTCVIICFSLQAQPAYKIKGCLTDFPYNRVLLSAINGSSNRVLDTCVVRNGCFEFSLKPSYKRGMYSIILDKKTNAFIRIIFNHENIEFYSNFKYLLDSMNFIHSAENKLFYRNAKFLSNYAKKLDLANKVIAVYSNNDAFSKSAIKEIANLKKRLDDHNNEMVRPVDSLLYRKFYKAQQPVNAPANLSEEQKRVYLREHYFDNVDFTCEPLIRTDILSGLITKFIALFESKTSTRTDQENNYIKAVESLLSQASVNEEMHKFIEQNLVQVFQYGEYDSIGAYIKEKQVSSGMCMSDVESAQLKASIESIKRVSVGQPAPEIAITDLAGKSFRLSDIKYPYTLVVFWSSHCGHCTKMLPELSELYKSQKNNQLEVVAISTEPKRQDWLTFLNNGEYNWINYLDPDGFKSQITKDYNIIGTPTFLLLDENKVIISKPNSIENLDARLKELNLVY